MRTQSDIIWSCVATLFICTWVTIHPNIPPRNEGSIVFLTLVVPELMLIWAYRQWALATDIGELFKGENGSSLLIQLVYKEF